MADTGKKVAPEVAPNNNVNEVEVAGPAESPRASYLVKTKWPHGSFNVGNDVPIVTLEGTMLTKAQYDLVAKVAPDYGIDLDVEEVK